jgi:hypothetical protein
MDALARARFGSRYDAVRGIVRAGPEHYRLREELSEVPRRRLADPDVQFFVDANPGHAAGDELCCLAPLTRENFTPAAWRVIGTVSPESQEMTCRSPGG